MSRDAVADLAKSRQVHEKSLFEEGRQRVVQIPELRKSPEIRGNAGVGGGQAEEVGQDSETTINNLFQLLAHAFLGRPLVLPGAALASGRG